MMILALPNLAHPTSVVLHATPCKKFNPFLFQNFDFFRNFLYFQLYLLAPCILDKSKEQSRDELSKEFLL